VISTACSEECDDGAANDDTTSDACRTTCRRAHCGDAVIDSGEVCDDGNVESCDGCSSTCVPEPGLGCGDGLVEPTCGESCDDGNQIVGDGCSPGCVAERVPGKGALRNDCIVEWSVNNQSNVPLLAADGQFNSVQICHDGDPLCDFDGGQAGSCTILVAVCANNTNLPGCEAPERLASWTVVTPSANKALRDPLAAAIRGTLLGTIPGAIVGPTTRDLCSQAVPIAVPLRGGPGAFRARKITLKTRADLYSGAKDKDFLKLVCLP
jgi:cysteine-rich repeat protein